MILTRAPYRISFFGGGTDYDTWFNRHGGVFLSSAIDHHVSIILRRKPALDSHQYRIVWRMLEDVNRVDHIQHPFVRAALARRNFDTGLDVVYFGDLPHGSGMGSSSSFGVAFLTALNQLMNISQTPHEMAQEVYEIERNILQETVGIQDQMASAHGGFNFGEIAQDGTVSITPIAISQDRLVELNSRLLLIFTGLSRHASEIASAQIDLMDTKEQHLKQMTDIAYRARKVLESDEDLDHFGELLNQTWTLKRQLSPLIETDIANSIYEKATKHGAIGGKLLGAGGGGFMCFYIADGRYEEVSDALSEYGQMPFKLAERGPRMVIDRPQRYADYYDKIWTSAK